MTSPAARLGTQINHVILVLSGKGGVGKSTVACQLAMVLASTRNTADPTRFNRVGILDVDVCGPSVPKMCGVEGAGITRAAGLMVPVEMFAYQRQQQQQLAAQQQSSSSSLAATDGTSIPIDPRTLKVMSIAFLLSSATEAVVWRGPRKDAVIKQFLFDVDWGTLDYLIVDTPPGTSDEHMTLCEALRDLNPTGAVVVTTPQLVSTDDVRKELAFCHKLSLRCLGIVENMSGFVCPHCAECTAIFSKGGGKKLATMYDIAFLGAIPIDPSVCSLEDLGRCVVPQEAPASGTVSPPAVATGDDVAPTAASAPALTGAAAALVDVVAAIMAQVARVEHLRVAQVPAAA